MLSRIVSANRVEHLRLLASNYELQLPRCEVERPANLICGCLTWVCIGSRLIKPASSDKSVIKSFSSSAETSFTMEILASAIITTLGTLRAAPFQISRQHALRQLKCGIMDEHGPCKSREDNKLLFDLLKTTTAARYSQRRSMEINFWDEKWSKTISLFALVSFVPQSGNLYLISVILSSYDGSRRWCDTSFNEKEMSVLIVMTWVTAL